MKRNFVPLFLASLLIISQCCVQAHTLHHQLQQQQNDDNSDGVLEAEAANNNSTPEDPFAVLDAQPQQQEQEQQQQQQEQEQQQQQQQQQPEEASWYGPVVAGDFIAPGMQKQSQQQTRTTTERGGEGEGQQQEGETVAYHGRTPMIVSIDNARPDLKRDEQDHAHHHHHHHEEQEHHNNNNNNNRHHHKQQQRGSAPMALSPGEVEDRVTKNYFGVSELTSPAANKLTVWNDIVKPALPMAILGLTQDYPFRYALPIAASLAWPTVLRAFAKLPTPAPNNAFMPAAPTQNTINSDEHLNGIAPADRYGPPPPPPPIPPPLPGNYESTGVPFRGHLLMPAHHPQ